MMGGRKKDILSGICIIRDGRKKRESYGEEKYKKDTDKWPLKNLYSERLLHLP